MTEQEMKDYEERLNLAREIKRKITSLESALKQYQSEGYNANTILVIKNRDVSRSCFQADELIASVKEHILFWFENKRAKLMEELHNV